MDFSLEPQLLLDVVYLKLDDNGVAPNLPLSEKDKDSATAEFLHKSMFSKNKRATTEDIQKIVQKGKKQQSPNLRIHTMELSHSPSRYAVVVPKKIIPKAFLRNTIKRRVRAVLKSIQIPDNYSVVVYVKKGIDRCDTQEIKNQIETLL
tara:strand:+ start:7861 stop:8307 length:447 start_codon:yes stop_codon:yes gene_type:complete